MIVDTYLVYQFLRRLVTPFVQMPAYKYGIIDANGNFLRKRSELVTPQEKAALGLFDILVINLKRILAKVPGGRSRLASLAAAMYLLRQQNNVTEQNINNILFTLEEDFNSELSHLENLYEDAPVMSVSSGAIKGIGATPDDIAVPRKAAKKYKEKNASEFMRMIRRKLPEETSLEYHKGLNPKLWDEGRLKPEVRGKLIQIADAWREFAKIPAEMVREVIITGGNVNYNYTDKSDVDLHLVIDRDAFGPDRMFTDEYLQDKKILWSFAHQDISIYGYPVELYAQDINEQPHSGQGVYSITNDSWIQYPEYLGLDFEKDYHLQKKVQHYKDLIDKMIDQKASAGTIDMVKNKIRTMRGDSIAKSGEFAFGNLVFKDLRNAGYLDKMDDYEKTMKDKALSL